MAVAEAAVASFNPDDASGLIDDVRATITGAKVDYFTAKNGKNAGARFVNADVTFNAAGQEFTEHYMIGNGDEWTPNATKTGVIPAQEGKKIWNKSDIFKFMKSLADAGFPKSKLGGDLSTLVGADVHVKRVTQDGQTYKDEKGQDRQRTVMLVTKVYAAEAAGKGAVKGAGSSKASAPAAAAPAAGGDDDTYVTELLVDILGQNNGSILRDKLAQPVFIALTRAKKAGIRTQVTARIQSDEFLNGLAEQGLITFDGKAITIAG